MQLDAESAATWDMLEAAGARAEAEQARTELDQARSQAAELQAQVAALTERLAQFERHALDMEPRDKLKELGIDASSLEWKPMPEAKPDDDAKP